MIDKKMFLAGLAVCCLLLSACSGPGLKDAPSQADITPTEAVETAQTKIEQSVTKSQEETEETDDIKPEDRLLRVHGKLYRGTADTGPMGDSGCVDGEITSATENQAVPTDDGQSNFGAVGNHYTKDSGDGFIMVFIEDEWYCFYEETE